MSRPQPGLTLRESMAALRSPALVPEIQSPLFPSSIITRALSVRSVKSASSILSRTSSISAKSQNSSIRSDYASIESKEDECLGPEIQPSSHRDVDFVAWCSHQSSTEDDYLNQLPCFTVSPDAVIQTSRLLCLAPVLRRCIWSYVFPQPTGKKVLLSPWFAVKDSFKYDDFVIGQDVWTTDVLNAMLACRMMRDDLRTYLLTHYHFHVTLSPFTGKELCPGSHKFLKRYRDRVQHLTIEVDLTRLGFGVERGSGRLGTLEAKIATLFTEFILWLSERPGHLSELHLMCRRYVGMRPAHHNVGDSSIDPTTVAYCSVDFHSLVNPVMNLQNTVRSLRLSGFPNDVTEGTLLYLFQVAGEPSPLQEPGDAAWPDYFYQIPGTFRKPPREELLLYSEIPSATNPMIDSAVDVVRDEAALRRCGPTLTLEASADLEKYAKKTEKDSQSTSTSLTEDLTNSTPAAGLGISIHLTRSRSFTEEVGDGLAHINSDFDVSNFDSTMVAEEDSQMQLLPQPSETPTTLRIAPSPTRPTPRTIAPSVSMYSLRSPALLSIAKSTKSALLRLRSPISQSSMGDRSVENLSSPLLKECALRPSYPVALTHEEWNSSTKDPKLQMNPELVEALKQLALGSPPTSVVRKSTSTYSESINSESSTGLFTPKPHQGGHRAQRTPFSPEQSTSDLAVAHLQSEHRTTTPRLRNNNTFPRNARFAVRGPGMSFNDEESIYDITPTNQRTVLRLPEVPSPTGRGPGTSSRIIYENIRAGMSGIQQVRHDRRVRAPPSATRFPVRPSYAIPSNSQGPDKHSGGWSKGHSRSPGYSSTALLSVISPNIKIDGPDPAGNGCNTLTPTHYTRVTSASDFAEQTPVRKRGRNTPSNEQHQTPEVPLISPSKIPSRIPSPIPEADEPRVSTPAPQHNHYLNRARNQCVYRDPQGASILWAPSPVPIFDQVSASTTLSRARPSVPVFNNVPANTATSSSAQTHMPPSNGMSADTIPSRARPPLFNEAPANTTPSRAHPAIPIFNEAPGKTTPSLRPWPPIPLFNDAPGDTTPSLRPRLPVQLFNEVPRSSAAPPQMNWPPIPVFNEISVSNTATTPITWPPLPIFNKMPTDGTALSGGRPPVPVFNEMPINGSVPSGARPLVPNFKEVLINDATPSNTRFLVPVLSEPSGRSTLGRTPNLIMDEHLTPAPPLISRTPSPSRGSAGSRILDITPNSLNLSNEKDPAYLRSIEALRSKPHLRLSSDRLSAYDSGIKTPDPSPSVFQYQRVKAAKSAELLSAQLKPLHPAKSMQAMSAQQHLEATMASGPLLAQDQQSNATWIPEPRQFHQQDLPAQTPEQKQKSKHQEFLDKGSKKHTARSAGSINNLPHSLSGRRSNDRGTVSDLQAMFHSPATPETSYSETHSERHGRDSTASRTDTGHGSLEDSNAKKSPEFGLLEALNLKKSPDGEEAEAALKAMRGSKGFGRFVEKLGDSLNRRGGNAMKEQIAELTRENERLKKEKEAAQTEAAQARHEAATTRVNLAASMQEDFF